MTEMSGNGAERAPAMSMRSLLMQIMEPGVEYTTPEIREKVHEADPRYSRRDNKAGDILCRMARDGVVTRRMVDAPAGYGWSGQVTAWTLV